MSNEDYIQEFVDEATTHLESIEEALLKLEKSPENANLINSIFRSVHSIKGTAGFFGLKKLVNCAHSIENLFGIIRRSEIKVDPKIIDVTLESLDLLKKMVFNISESENVNIDNTVKKVKEIIEKNEKKGIESKEKLELITPEKESLNIDKEQKVTVKYALSHGHNIYKIKLKLKEDVESKNLNPVVYFKKIESIGLVIDAYTDISEVTGLKNIEEAEINYIFIFSTVLDEELVSLALQIEPHRIIKLDVNLKVGEVKEILMDESLEKNNDKNDKILKNQETESNFEKNEIIEEDVEEDNNLEEPPNKEQRVNKISPDETVRVNVSLLNSLLDLASEMVLGRNQLLRTLEFQRKKIEGLEPILQNIDLTTTELQGKIMNTRMQPVSKIFNKFPRIIREMTRKLGKEIELEMHGTEVELDKSIIEALTDPLTHLIRNAVDHGIEKPDVREKNGKAKKGKITLKAYHEGGRVNIEIKDNGTGIDPEKIKKKALSNKLIKKESLEKLSEKDILSLIFEPGFSTAEKVTDVSGRGVGMDVVKTNIEKLGGSIDIKTEIGSGTTFRLMVPLTLAIISSLIIEIGGNKFALPQVNLQEIYRLKENDKNKIEHIGNAKVLRLRGNLLPIVDLSDVLKIQKLETKKENVKRILVVKVGTKKYGIMVDKIHETEEILVKPLSIYLRNSIAYSGVTIMGDGKIAMILDAEGISKKANLKYVEDMIEKTDAEKKHSQYAVQESQNFMLFKCSGNEMLAIDLSMVSRVEVINKNDIEKIGGNEYIQYRNTEYRIIRPEDHLPIEKNNNLPEKLYVIIPKFSKHPLGILIHKIIDTHETKLQLNDESKKVIKSKGILGTTIINKKIVLILNSFELFETAVPELYEDDKNLKSKEQKNILLLEDTEFFLKLEKNYLENANYKVHWVKNGKEGVEMLKKVKNIDAIVSDIVMPEMTGEEFIRWVRSQKEFKHIPAIAVTSMTGDKIKNSVLKSGFNYYETKIDKERLLTLLKEIFEKEVVQS